MDWSLIPKSLGGWIATVSTFILGLLMWRVQVSKGKVDESATVLRAWKEMVDAHQLQINGMREEFTAYKKTALDEFSAYKKTALDEITSLRERIAATDAEFARYRRDTDKRIRDLEDENAGLKRAIVQSDRSTVVLLGKTGHEAAINDMAQRLDKETPA